VAGWVLARVLGRLVRSALERSEKLQPSPLLAAFMVNVVRKSTFILALIVALDQLGVDTKAIVAGIGASGLIIGFALKDTLSNFAAGFLLLLYRPFDVGDYVDVGGIEGTIADLTLVSTVLNTGDNKLITVPNSAVWGKAITNFTAPETRRIDLVVGIAYDDDPARAREVLVEIVSEHEAVLAEPEPLVRFKDLGDSAVTFDVRPWVSTADYWTVRAELLETIKARFDAEGLSFPYPQQELWVHEMAA